MSLWAVCVGGKCMCVWVVSACVGGMCGLNNIFVNSLLEKRLLVIDSPFTPERTTLLTNIGIKL